MMTDWTGADTTDAIQDCATNMNIDVDAVGLPDGACCTSGMQCAGMHCDYETWTCRPLLDDGTTADSGTDCDTHRDTADAEAESEASTPESAAPTATTGSDTADAEGVTTDGDTAADAEAGDSEAMMTDWT